MNLLDYLRPRHRQTDRQSRHRLFCDARHPVLLPRLESRHPLLPGADRQICNNLLDNTLFSIFFLWLRISVFLCI